MLNFNRIFANKRLINLMYFVFFIVIIIAITILGFSYMDYITPKLKIAVDNKTYDIVMQRKMKDNLKEVLTPVEIVEKKKIKPITVQKGQNIKIISEKRMALKPSIKEDEKFVIVPMHINLKEEDIKTTRFEYVENGKSGYYFSLEAPNEEGVYTYNMNLEYRKTMYIFTIHIKVK